MKFILRLFVKFLSSINLTSLNFRRGGGGEDESRKVRDLPRAEGRARQTIGSSART
jgi:hypothetical protein